MVECQCHLEIAVLKWYSPGVMKEKAQRIYTLSDSVNLVSLKMRKNLSLSLLVLNYL